MYQSSGMNRVIILFDLNNHNHHQTTISHCTMYHNTQTTMPTCFSYCAPRIDTDTRDWKEIWCVSGISWNVRHPQNDGKTRNYSIMLVSRMFVQRCLLPVFAKKKMKLNSLPLQDDGYYYCYYYDYDVPAQGCVPIHHSIFNNNYWSKIKSIALFVHYVYHHHLVVPHYHNYHQL